MNKTISINLYGSVFSIEEDAYQKLKIYLEGLKSYFSTDADHLEIMTDIESRIAEKFNAALAQQAKAVVEMSDVDNLIQEIGTPEQFQHFETADDSNFEDEPHQYQAKANNYQRTLYRDSDQKMLGGVCAGIAQYLDIDITLVRVLTLATFIFAGVGFIPYIILWVVLPEGKRDQYIKGERTVNNSDFKTKLYRNNEDKVVAGVSSGVAAYLGLEPTIVRLLFVLATIWGGFGIILYVILWIAMPKARTLFDKAAMHGQEPNLANIENLKKNKTLGNNRPQPYGQNFSKILAMPMGIIEGVIKIIGTFFQPFLAFFKMEKE